MRRLCALLALPVLAFATSSATAGGTVKGQIVFGGDAPPRAKLNVDKDKDACLKDGDLLSEKYVVDPTSKGVRWAIVWLQDPADAKTPLPGGKKPKTKVAIDQPTCMFEPHIVVLEETQTLTIKNSAKISHNVKVDGGLKNPNLNSIIAPGKSLDIKNFKNSPLPVPIACNIHGWMKGYVKVINHPYFAVTDKDGNFEIKDAPAGKWNLVVWQEEKGYVNGGKDGQPVEVKDGATVEEKIELKP